MLKVHLCAVIYIFCLSNLLSQSLEFFQEEIEITAAKENCIVQGTYYFKNTNPEKIVKMIYYPFCLNDFLSYPDSIQVVDLIKNTNIAYRKHGKGVSFPIHLDGKSITILKVIYIQKTSANQMEYILTTTRQWGKPLEKADFTIKIPLSYQLKYCTFDYNYRKKNNQYNIYRITKEQFYPDKNLKIRWKE